MVNFDTSSGVKKEFSDKAKENIVAMEKAGWLNTSNRHTSKVKSSAAGTSVFIW